MVMHRVRWPLKYCTIFLLGAWAGTLALGEAEAPKASNLPVFQNALFPWGQGTRFEKPSNSVPHVECISESPDGGSIAWGDSGGNVFFSDVWGKRILVVQDEGFSKPAAQMVTDAGYPVRGIHFKDNKSLYWFAWNSTVWEALITGDTVQPLRKFRCALWTFGPGTFVSDWLITSCPSGGLGFWPSHTYSLCKQSVRDGRVLERCDIYPRAPRRYHNASVMAVSHDRKRLAFASENNAGIALLDPLKLECTLGVEFACALAFSPDDRLLAIASHTDDRLLVYDRTTRKMVVDYRLADTGETVHGMGYSSDGALWFCYGLTVYRMGPSDGKPAPVMEIRNNAILHVGRYLYAGRFDGVVERYSMP